jgi:hypothetical protein
MKGLTSDSVNSAAQCSFGKTGVHSVVLGAYCIASDKGERSVRMCKVVSASHRQALYPLSRCRYPQPRI